MLRQQRLASKVSRLAAERLRMMSTDAVPDKSSCLITPASSKVMPSGYEFPLSRNAGN